MSSSVKLDLPFPISLNGMFPQARSGRRFCSKAYRAWKNEAGWAIRAARIRPFDGPVSVKIVITPPDRRRRDADNLSKCCLDALVQNGVLLDDCSKYVRRIDTSLADEPDKARPRATITITSANASLAGGSKRQAMELSQRD